MDVFSMGVAILVSSFVWYYLVYFVGKPDNVQDGTPDSYYRDWTRFIVWPFRGTLKIIGIVAIFLIGISVIGLTFNGLILLMGGY